MKVALASTNEGKLRELRALFPEWDIEPVVADYPDETGETFFENARAKTQFARTVVDKDVPVLGEDSGLEVDALDGRPGVRSARFAGADASDAENVERPLRDLDGLSVDVRGARYVSELVLFSVDGELRGTGTLEGRVGTERRGSEGFGYDPVFIPTGQDRTVAELGDAWKRENSHRARAAQALREQLGKLPDGV